MKTYNFVKIFKKGGSKERTEMVLTTLQAKRFAEENKMKRTDVKTWEKNTAHYYYILTPAPKKMY